MQIGISTKSFLDTFTKSLNSVGLIAQQQYKMVCTCVSSHLVIPTLLVKHSAQCSDKAISCFEAVNFIDVTKVRYVRISNNIRVTWCV
ncbi:hypothetical protein SDC9_182079 [bioreactor metagenome]|uniref:Uncharacterized protein n=1 Tax=bioreactor metagenome TaxID=1076179 RepID=A0A645H6H5_9ZZZZ